MSRRCDLTGKGPQVGHKVSHSNIKTKRRFLPNLCNVTLISESLGRSVRLRVSANALKSVDHRGGLDAFLLKAHDTELSGRALLIKREVAKKASGSRRRLMRALRRLRLRKIFEAREPLARFFYLALRQMKTCRPSRRFVT